MQSKFLFLSVIFFFLSIITAYLLPTVVHEIRNKETRIGGVVKIMLTVNNVKSGSNISWEEYDRFFSESKEIILLEIKSFKKPGIYNHEITFTSADAKKIKIPRLTFVVDKKKYQTKDVFVNFKASYLPSKLHDIKPIITQNWTSIICVVGVFLVFIILIFISLTALYHFLKNRIEVLNSRRQEHYYRERLSIFELESVSSGLISTVSINTVTDLIEKYILTLETAPQRKFYLQSETYNVHKNQLLELSNKLKFLPNSLVIELYPSFISSLTVFMNLTSAKER